MNSRDYVAHSQLSGTADERLEQRIARLARQVEGLHAIGKRDAARDASARMARLISMRSAEQVARMELAQRLR